MSEGPRNVLSWFKMLLLTCLAFLAPVKPLMVGAIVLVALDSITGVFAAHRRGEPITSAGFRRTITKGTVYTLAILASYVAEKMLLDHAVPVAKLVAGAIGVTEIKSCLENCGSALGMPVFRALMAKFGSVNDEAVIQPAAEKPVVPARARRSRRPRGEGR